MGIAPGLRVGRYEVLRKLGQGGFGILYVARDVELDRDVALKFLRPEHVTRPQVMQRFLQEARAAAKINHAGIVTVFECGVVVDTGTRADGTVYIAMELLAGESLGARLKREGRLTPALAIGLCRQVTAALAAAHRSGIVHRDLKPDNIFLVPDPAVRGGVRVKILDFGIAKLADGQLSGSVRTHSAMVLGTPMYMSPEQCKSSAKVDHRSDIYATGCILFELLCGRPPYDGDAGELIAKHQLAPVPTARTLVPELPADLDRLVTQMLAKAPDDRPGSMEFVDEALAGWDGETRTVVPAARALVTPAAPVASAAPAEARPTSVTTLLEGAGEGLRRAAPAPAWKLIAGAGAVVLLGIALGIAVTLSSSDEPPRSSAAAPPRVDAVIPAAAVDAAVASATPPAVALAPAADELRLECAKLAADRQWAALPACSDRLAASDPEAAQRLRAQAVAETAAAAQAEVLRAHLDALELERARAALARIPAESLYRRDAEVAVAELADRLAPPARQAAPPPAPAKPGCDAAALKAKGDDHLQSGLDAAALAAFEASLRCRSDATVVMLAFMAACRSKNVAKARAYYRKLPDPGTSIAQICKRNGIDLP